jgi:thiamine-monophosphate kinase
VGWRSAAANLSDLAAMGATPVGITVGLGLPKDTSVPWLEAFYHGLRDCLDPWQTPILGGDVVRSPITSISITALGQVSPQRVIRRSTAQVGDCIVATGLHGASRAGLELLLHPERGESLSDSDRAYFIRAHQRPQPRLDILPYLFNAPEPLRIAGMDSSDGLADAILQICRASQVGANLEQENLPISELLLAWVGEEKALDWTLYGGEDFELVLCLSPILAPSLVQYLGEKAKIIGRVTDSKQVILSNSLGQEKLLSLEKGFQHFASD